MYAVTGASGHVGRRVSERLLSEHQKVRVISRNRGSLLPLERDGAEIWIGDLRDSDFLARAFTGTQAVFAMIPPSYGESNFRGYQNEVGRSIAKAVVQSGLKYVVNLSSMGADLPYGTGPILGLHDQEIRLDGIAGVNVLHLRPTFFLENLLGAAPGIERDHVLSLALRSDLRFPAVATRDIADVASDRLLNLDWHGSVVQNLLGERDVTPTEIAVAIGKAIGLPSLSYRQASYEEAQQGMTRMGCSFDVARCMIEMLRGMNEGRVIVGGTPRTSDSTTRTSIEQFALEFAATYASTAKIGKAA